MRIFFLIARSDTIGGANVHVRDMGHALIKQGHEVFICTGPEGPFCHALHDLGIPFHSCPTLQRAIHPIQDMRAVLEIRRAIQRFQPDLVSIHSSKTGILGRVACWSLGIPCIFTVHGWAFTEGVPRTQRRLYSILERIFAPLAKRIICVSEYDRSIAMKNGISSHRLLCIHNGMPDICTELHARPGSVDDGIIRLVMVARFDIPKDHAALLYACSDLPQVHLDLLGDGPNLNAMRELAATLDMSDRVRFPGYCTDVAKVMSDAHLFALISHWEGFPRTTIEAMRAGLPTVVSDVGGAAEAVMEGITGYTIPRGDVGRLRERLRKLSDDQVLRQRMGQAGRERYETEFTFDRMFEQTFSVYKEVLQEEILKPSSKILTKMPDKNLG